MRLYNDQLIKKWEQLRLEAYKPTPNDKWTIGWGHTKGVFPGMKISEETAQKYFDEDVAWAVDAVNRLVKVGLTQNQFDALTSIVFNIGETNFKRSTLLRKLNSGDYEGAAEQFTVWNKQRQKDGSLKVLRGLVRRRAEEMELFLEPDDSVPASDIPAENGTTGIAKPLTKSREVISGAVAGATGVLGAISGLTPSLQDKLFTALCVALIGFGAYVVYNRVVASKRGER